MPSFHLLIKIISVSCVYESGLLHLQTNIAAVNLDQQRSITRETRSLHQLQCDLEMTDKAQWLYLAHPQVLAVQGELSQPQTVTQ